MEYLHEIYVAIPCCESIPVQTVESIVHLKCPKGYKLHFRFLEGSLIYDARNILVEDAIKRESEYIFWIDSDMVFEPDIIEKLMKNEVDFVTGIYYRRKPPFSPVVFDTLKVDENRNISFTEFKTIPNNYFEIGGCGFGAVLMKTCVAKKVVDKYHMAFNPLPNAGEDIAFCLRARGCGYCLYADGRVRLGHIAHTVVTDKAYEASLGGKNA